MTKKRTCRHVPLSKQPLVIALCQVRFTRVRKMANYISEIQDEFRRKGFPIERVDRIQHVTVTPKGPQFDDQERWEYRSKDEQWSISVLQDSVVLQTTAYDRFEGFVNHLALAVRTVLATTEQDELGLVERIGLRFVDLIQPREGEDHRFYLRPGLHGLADAVFRPDSQRLQVLSVGRTLVGSTEGTMVVRVSQNDQGLDLPPDLIGGIPKHTSRARVGELVTLVDMDHYIEGKFEPVEDFIVASAFQMHDHIIETFHNHVVTEQAVEVWR